MEKADIRFSLRELDALDYCRKMRWATSDEEIAENTNLSKAEAAVFVEKAATSGLITA